MNPFLKLTRSDPYVFVRVNPCVCMCVCACVSVCMVYVRVCGGYWVQARQGSVLLDVFHMSALY